MAARTKGPRTVKLTDPAGLPYEATTPVELYNLVSQGYSLPRGTSETEAAAHLADDGDDEPPTSTATQGKA